MRSILRLVAAALRERWGIGLLILLGLLLEMAFTAAVPMSFKFLVDDAIIPRNEGVLISILAGLAAGLVVTSLAGLGLDYLYAKFITEVLNDLRWRMFSHLQRLSMSFYSRAQAPDIVSRFSSDLSSLDHALGSAVDGSVSPSFDLLLSAILLCFIDWRLGLIAILAIPAGISGPKFITPRATEAIFRRKENESQTFGTIEESISGQAVVKAFALEKTMLARFTERMALQAASSLRVNFLSSMIERSSYVGTLLVQVLVLGVGGYMAFNDQISIGSLVAFQALFGTFVEALSNFAGFYPQLVQAGAGMQRIEELLDETPNVADPPDAPPLPPLERSILFADVSFGYTPERLVLKNLTLTIRAGESVAFVGASGSGKSTVLSVLTRFYEPDGGTIAFDGQDVRSYSLDSLRSQLGIVFQESILFHNSIRENIRFGKPEASDDEVEAAARAAELHDVIAAMPEGYDTAVGNGHLSGGQRQRIAIARALLRDPQVLVLDEATSALDPASEAAINETLERVAEGRTMVSVTHRLASVARFDRIFVMDGGQVVEHGRHEELLAAHGVYSRLWEKQSGFVISERGGRARIEAFRLLAVPMLQSLSEEDLAILADSFTTERSPAGREVFREGDPGDSFYILVRGRVTAWVKTPDGEEKEVRTMDDGDYFGEIALMTDTTRTATVRTETDCIFLTLGRDQFLRLLQREGRLRESFQRVVDERLARSGSLREPAAPPVQ